VTLRAPDVKKEKDEAPNSVGEIAEVSERSSGLHV